MIYLASVRANVVREVKERFRLGGIPIYVEPDYTKRNSLVAGLAGAYFSAITGPDYYKINICLDEQLEDAKCLFENPNYEVKSPVDIKDFEESIKKLAAVSLNESVNINKILTWIFGLIFIGFVLAILVAVFTS